MPTFLLTPTLILMRIGFIFLTRPHIHTFLITPTLILMRIGFIFFTTPHINYYTCVCNQCQVVASSLTLIFFFDVTFLGHFFLFLRFLRFKLPSSSAFCSFFVASSLQFFFAPLLLLRDSK